MNLYRTNNLIIHPIEPMHFVLIQYFGLVKGFPRRYKRFNTPITCGHLSVY